MSSKLDKVENVDVFQNGTTPISLTDQALPEAQTLSIGQGRPPAGCGGPVGRGASCRSPFDHQHLTAGLVLI